MATAERRLPRLAAGEESRLLAEQWRRLTRAATVIAVLTSPAAFAWFHVHEGLSVGKALALTVLCVIAFRGVLDLVFRRFIPWPSLFGTDEAQVKEDDVVSRKRTWFWARLAFWATLFAVAVTLIWLFRGISHGQAWWETFGWTGAQLGDLLSSRQLWIQVLFIFFLFIGNFLIFFGPLMLMGISQMQAFEPGDADWGVRLEDVRGQAEAKEEVRRIVNLWQSGEAFERAGGKRERGILFLGAPGTGKTMLSKAIATGFNCPFLSMPGSGFAQTFIGMDVVIVRYMAAKARRLARKWGGQCIVFIDEIDAVGRRRAALNPEAGFFRPEPRRFEDYAFESWGALSPSGDTILENRAWREHVFRARAPEPATQKFLPRIVNQAFPGMFGGMGGMALNQLLVVMDGIDNPPFLRRVFTKRVNTILDASFIVPRRLGTVPLRLPAPRPRGAQIYFIGATNVPIEVLDPALTRPGRMGRHVWFRTPTKQDRLDVFDLYITKVSHDPELDSERRRDEIARITMGYSPAMIEQVCSMALTYAHHDGRERFEWEDLVEAMTTIESGTAINIEYVPEETRAVAIHEAGHAVAAHVYMKEAESTRVSIRRRGGALGHHQALEKDERFTSWQSEEMARLIWGLGAMAAERVFYGENSTGVGGDVQGVTARAAWMVGTSAMAPQHVELNGGFRSQAKRDEAREKIMERFERIGIQIMNRAGGGGPFHADPIAGVLGDRDKRRMVAQILGQAYMSAHTLVEANKAGVEKVADVLVDKKEIYGDELLELLNSASLETPEVDLTKDAVWPKI